MEQKTGAPTPTEPQDMPEIPPTEPTPAPVQDPPAEPNPTPYVVGDSQRTMTNLAKDRMMNNGERKERRGFASMSPEKQREIASKGGRAAHQKGTAHEWTSDEARNAGRKGGQISRGGRGRLAEPGDAPGTTVDSNDVPSEAPSLSGE
jgi:general stress protein YciG